jgi:phosphomevalonate kinase
VIRVAASAPGKLMVSGEYAVLEGAVSVVASVDVRAYARWVLPGEDARALPAEAAHTRILAEGRYGAVEGALTIDASDLRKSGRKLGLGSSAAAAAAVAGAILGTHGRSVNTPEGRQEAFQLALKGHKAIAPEGSGADVAAAALGGFVRYRLSGQEVAEAEPVAWPSHVLTRVVWTGKEARTSEFVRAVRAYEARDAGGYARIRDALKAEAARFADAIQGQRGADIVAAAGAYGEGMARLGVAAGVDIVTAELQTIADLARAHGGSAKPSGAGGGDVAIAFFASEADAQGFDGACVKQGLDLLDLGLGAEGVRIEAAGR